MVIMNAAAGAAAAGAAAARRMREEEESMTNYTKSDLSDDWEFKILRSATGRFKHAEELNKALAEEAEAGWVLLEKFDNGRIRLKRPASAKENDKSLRLDPYQTVYGTSDTQLAAMIVAGVATVVVLMFAIISVAAR